VRACRISNSEFVALSGDLKFEAAPASTT